jgi:hypothetical protein
MPSAREAVSGQKKLPVGVDQGEHTDRGLQEIAGQSDQPVQVRLARGVEQAQPAELVRSVGVLRPDKIHVIHR